LRGNAAFIIVSFYKRECQKKTNMNNSILIVCTAAGIFCSSL